jgi:hypothetical protein
VAFRGAYSAGMLQIGHSSIDMYSIPLHVEFENGLSISVMKNKATRNKNVPMEIVKM